MFLFYILVCRNLEERGDYLSMEWYRKPVAMVGYGGISAGTPFKQLTAEGSFEPIVENAAAAKACSRSWGHMGNTLKAWRSGPCPWPERR
ncbi:MAG TPA: hypothetical protein VFL76_03625 [Edaphocola sp.]|nr:hypothetical protein [Edaphocola sp.]